MWDHFTARITISRLRQNLLTRSLLVPNLKAIMFNLWYSPRVPIKKKNPNIATNWSWPLCDPWLIIFCTSLALSWKNTPYLIHNIDLTQGGKRRQFSGRKCFCASRKQALDHWGPETRKQGGTSRVSSFSCLIPKEMVPAPEADPGIWLDLLTLCPELAFWRADLCWTCY